MMTEDSPEDKPQPKSIESDKVTPQPVTTESTKSMDVEDKNIATKATEKKEVDKKAAEKKEVEKKEAEQKEAEKKAVEKKEAETKAAAKKAAEQKEAEKKAAEKKADDKKEAEKKELKKKEKEIEGKIKREPYRLPIFGRILNLAIGLAFVGVSIFVLINDTLSVNTILLILAVMLVVSGILRVLNAFYEEDIGGTKRIIKFTIGLFLITVSVLVYFDFNFGEDLLFALLGISLILQGLGRIFIGFSHPAYPMWVKLVHLILGVVLAVIGVIAMLPGVFGLSIDINIIQMLVLGFFVNGLSRFITGLFGISESRKKK